MENYRYPQDPDVDPSNPEHQKAALSIQTKYRQYHAKKEVEKIREEQAAITIQSSIRGYHARKEVEELQWVILVVISHFCLLVRGLLPD